LKEIEKATGAHLKKEGALPLSRKQAATDAGLSEHQQKTAVRVANIPEETFNELVESQQGITQKNERTPLSLRFHARRP
jgi:hypothetical protein